MTLLRAACEVYLKHLRLLSFFAIPFLLALPLALLLPNYLTTSGIFLRLGSLQRDITLIEAASIGALALASLYLFCLALVGINFVVREARTLARITREDVEGLAIAATRLLAIFLLVALISGAVAFALYPMAHKTIGLAIALLVSLLALFAPQAIVLESKGIAPSIATSARLIATQPKLVLAFLLLGAALLIANTQLFIAIGGALGEIGYVARYLSIAITGLVIIPFLEVLKAQIYFTKWSIARV